MEHDEPTRDHVSNRFKIVGSFADNSVRFEVYPIQGNNNTSLRAMK